LIAPERARRASFGCQLGLSQPSYRCHAFQARALSRHIRLRHRVLSHFPSTETQLEDDPESASPHLELHNYNQFLSNKGLGQAWCCGVGLSMRRWLKRRRQLVPATVRFIYIYWNSYAVLCAAELCSLFVCYWWCLYTHTHTHTHICVCVRVYICIHMYVCIYSLLNLLIVNCSLMEETGPAPSYSTASFYQQNTPDRLVALFQQGQIV